MAILASLRSGTSRIMVQTGLPAALRSGIFAFLIVGACPALAQTVADQADNAAVNDFFRAMNSNIKEGAGTETVTVSNGRANVGYFRVRVSSASSNSSSEQRKGCKAAIRSLGNAALLDAVFARRYDMGLAISLPLTLTVPGESAPSNTRAEVNLFRLTQTSGKRCGFSLSYFEKEGDYTGPWIPIDHQAMAVPQVAVVRFKPWVSRENNKARVDAFWAGLGGFVNLIGGPVTELGSNLFGGGKDDYEIKGQANASLFSFTSDIKSADPPESTKRIVVNPTDGTSFTPKAYSFKWSLAGIEDGEAFAYKLDYTVEVQYWASRLFSRDTQKHFPDLGTYDAAKFRLLLGRNDVPGGKAWNAISQAIVTLSKQDTPEKFQIACDPAFADLATMGFSREDQALIVYGTAAGKGFTPKQLSSIECLFGPNRAEIEEKLAKFNIKPPVADTVILRPKMKSEQWYDVLHASSRAFSAPGNINGQSAMFRRYIDAKIKVGGDTELIINAAGVPVFGASQTPFDMDKADFLRALGSAKIMSAGCYSPRKAAAGTPIDFPFPELSGMDVSTDRQLAHLAEIDGKVFFVVLGVAGVDLDGTPVIDQIWFGDSLQATDLESRAVVADMLKNTDSACVTRPSFNAFLNAIK